MEDAHPHHAIRPGSGEPLASISFAPTARAQTGPRRACPVPPLKVCRFEGCVRLECMLLAPAQRARRDRARLDHRANCCARSAATSGAGHKLRKQCGQQSHQQKIGHPGGNPGKNPESISHRGHPILVAFAWESTKETINLPLGGLHGGCLKGAAPCWGQGSVPHLGRSKIADTPLVSQLKKV